MKLREKLKKELEEIPIFLFILLFMQSYLVGGLLGEPGVNVLTKLWAVSLLVTEFSAVVGYHQLPSLEKPSEDLGF